MPNLSHERQTPEQCSNTTEEGEQSDAMDQARPDALALWEQDSAFQRSAVVFRVSFALALEQYKDRISAFDLSQLLSVPKAYKLLHLLHPEVVEDQYNKVRQFCLTFKRKYGLLWQNCVHADVDDESSGERILVLREKTLRRAAHDLQSMVDLNKDNLSTMAIVSILVSLGFDYPPFSSVLSAQEMQKFLSADQALVAVNNLDFGQQSMPEPGRKTQPKVLSATTRISQEQERLTTALCKSGTIKKIQEGLVAVYIANSELQTDAYQIVDLASNSQGVRKIGNKLIEIGIGAQYFIDPLIRLFDSLQKGDDQLTSHMSARLPSWEELYRYALIVEAGKHSEYDREPNQLSPAVIRLYMLYMYGGEELKGMIRKIIVVQPSGNNNLGDFDPEIIAQLQCLIDNP